MPPTSYTPASPALITVDGDQTLGPTTMTAVPPTGGQYLKFNVVGYPADAGEVADCLNALVLRLQALETAASITSP